MLNHVFVNKITLLPSFVYLIFSNSRTMDQLLTSVNRFQVSMAFNKCDYS